MNIFDMAAEWSIDAMVIRMVSALIIGSVIGFDRGMKRRGAGLKTHALVCMGSALVMLTSQYMVINFDAKLDLARMGAQVISGVGFLGVGTIIVTGKNQVRGLTTAASLWACACLGLAVGIGYLSGALITLALVIFTLKVLNRVDLLVHKYSRLFELYVEFDCNKSVSDFIDCMRVENFQIHSFELGKSKIKGEGPNAIASVEVDNRSRRPELLDVIRKMDGVRYVEEL